MVSLDVENLFERSLSVMRATVSATTTSECDISRLLTLFFFV